jgi:hypothetical protein
MEYRDHPLKNGTAQAKFNVQRGSLLELIGQTGAHEKSILRSTNHGRSCIRCSIGRGTSDGPGHDQECSSFSSGKTGG